MTTNRDKYLRWGLTALELALIGVIAYILIRALITLTTPQSVWKPVGNGPVEPLSVASTGPTSVDLSFDPFHRTETVVIEVVPTIGEDAPETTLNLTMTGRTVPISAILKTPDGQERTYKVGDEILNGVTLESVTRGYIVLSQNGRLERLTFNESETTGLKSTAPQKSGQIQQSQNADILETLFRSINMAPEIKDGKPLGVKITPRQAGFDLGKFGLASGDVITQIGTTDLSQGIPNLNDLATLAATTGKTQVKLLRNGKPVTFEMKLR